MRKKHRLKKDLRVLLLDILAVNLAYFLALVFRAAVNGMSTLFGEAYNVADAASYCSIRELAERLCASHPPSRVVIDPAEGLGYAPACKLRLSTGKLEALGWKPRTGIMEAFDGLVASWRRG